MTNAAGHYPGPMVLLQQMEPILNPSSRLGWWRKEEKSTWIGTRDLSDQSLM